MGQKNIFIKGEKINLCAPEDDDFEEWASWFNDSSITTYLEQGLFPNTTALQKEFYESALKSGRFLCLIKTSNKKLLGVISLSEINYQRRSCQISLVCPVQSREAPLAALEAMALVTDHAFKNFNMMKVWAGQKYPGLKNWSQRLELLGYMTEGLSLNNFVNNSDVKDSAIIALYRHEYEKIADRRGGTLWMGEENMKKALAKIRVNTPLSQVIYENITTLHDKYCQILEKIELDVNS